MLKIENTEVTGWEAAIRGMRNPMNSWEKSDSNRDGCTRTPLCYKSKDYTVGPKDLDLMKSLIQAGADHSKFMRMISVTMDITAPLYWIAEHDTYKIGTTRNSCSFMHKGVSKQFDIEDFSVNGDSEQLIVKAIIPYLNELRNKYLETKDKKVFEAIRQILPSGYNQRYTWQANYQVCRNIYNSRHNHRLQEWIDFCEILKKLPYSELITL